MERADLISTVKDHLRRCIEDKDIEYHAEKIADKAEAFSNTEEEVTMDRELRELQQKLVSDIEEHLLKLEHDYIKNATAQEIVYDIIGDNLLALPPDEEQIRQLLWDGHPCVGKYGDDGELQCNRCFGQGDPIDFKRDSWHDIVVGIGKHTNQLIKEAKKEERERILTEDLPLDVYNRMELWWYEPENMEMIEDLCAGEFDEVSKLLRSFIVALRQALSNTEDDNG